MKIEWIDFNVIHHQPSGSNLVALEGQKNIPFDVKRVYYIYDLQKASQRGAHAHHKSHQLMVCLKGQCSVLLDNGQKAESIQLTNPNKGLMLYPYMWHEMSNFSTDCVLLVLADTHYNEKDYIRDYDEFMRYAKAPCGPL